jgi:hypothetical protein
MNILFLLADGMPPGERETLLIWGGIIMAIVVVGFVGIMVLKRRLMSSGESHQAPGFSLSELREMRDRGEITPEEYARTRAHVIEKVKARLDEEPKSKRSEESNGGTDAD